MRHTYHMHFWKKGKVIHKNYRQPKNPIYHKHSIYPYYPRHCRQPSHLRHSRKQTLATKKFFMSFLWKWKFRIPQNEQVIQYGHTTQVIRANILFQHNISIYWSAFLPILPHSHASTMVTFWKVETSMETSIKMFPAICKTSLLGPFNFSCYCHHSHIPTISRLLIKCWSRTLWLEVLSPRWCRLILDGAYLIDIVIQTDGHFEQKNIVEVWIKQKTWYATIFSLRKRKKILKIFFFWVWSQIFSFLKKYLK